MPKKRNRQQRQGAGPTGTAVATAGNGTAPPAAVNSLEPDANQFALLGEAIYRMRFAERFGMQYDGDRNVRKVGGYPKEVSYEAMAAMYDRDALAGRTVDMIAETTWRRPPEIIEVDSNGDAPEEPTEFMQAWTEFAKKLRVWNRLERADKLSRLGRYSVLLIGVSGTTDGGLSRPMRTRTNAAPGDDPNRRVLYLSAYSEKHATISQWETNAADERFGLPLKYTINLSSGVQGFRASALDVHHSHVLHIAEGLLEDDVYGRPVLRRIYNDLMDLQKIKTSSAETYWQIVAGILQANIDPNAQIGEDQLKDLDKQLQDIYHDLKRTFYGQGVELSRLSGNDPQPKGASDLAIKMIASGTEYPMRVLIGNETGERASKEDMDAYYGTVAERRINHAEPVILRPLIDRLIEAGALPRPAGEVQVVWPALHEESETEISEANRNRAQAAQALTPVGGNPLNLVEIDQDRNVWLRPTGERGQLSADELEGPDPLDLLGGTGDGGGEDEPEPGDEDVTPQGEEPDEEQDAGEE